MMPRTPNYGFERKERERAKAAKAANRAKAKSEKAGTKSNESGNPIADTEGR